MLCERIRIQAFDPYSTGVGGVRMYVMDDAILFKHSVDYASGFRLVATLTAIGAAR